MADKWDIGCSTLIECRIEIQVLLIIVKPYKTTDQFGRKDGWSHTN